MKNSTFSAQVANNLLKVLQGYTKGIRFIALLTILCTVGVGQMWAAEETYTFTSKSWGDSSNSWTSNKDGGQLSSGRGVQVSTNYSGASATSKSEFSNVSRVIVVYSTNASKGAGTINIQIGSNSAKSYTVTTTGGTTDRNAEFSFSPEESGKAKITVNCTTNSIYVKSITIETSGGSSTPATPYTVTFNAGSGTSTESLTETSAGAGVTLPTPTIDCGEWSFAGWAEESVANQTTTAPTTLFEAGDNYKPAENCTLYAVYTKTETSQGGGTTTVTSDLSFSNTNQRTSYSTTKQVWEQNGITLTNDKSNSTSNVGDYSNPARFYKSSKITITAPGNITQIEFNCVSGYVISITGATTSGTTVTVTLDGTNNTYTVNSLSAQVRLNSLSVTYTTSGGGSTTYYHSTPDCGGATPETFTVTFDANGHGKAPAAQTITSGETASEPTEPKETGYTFGGWYSNQQCTGDQFDFSTPITADITLYAKWTIATYTIKATLDHCTSTPEIPATYEFTGEEINLSYTITPEVGYGLPRTITFSGPTYTWDQSTGILTLTGVIKSDVTFTITAKKIHTIKWMVDGEEYTNGEPSTTVLNNERVSTLPTNPTLDCSGKTFVGWSDQEVTDGNKPSVLFTSAETSPQVLKNTIFHAVFATLTGSGNGQNTTDILTHEINGQGNTNTSYKDFSDKSYTSDAAYAGNSANGNNNEAKGVIQLRSDKSTSGIVTTTSGGYAKSITVDWHSHTPAERTLDIYGKNEAYADASNLYGNDNTTKGTKLGSIICGTSTVLTIDGDYQYIGLRSNNGAMYINSISIVWSSSAAPTYTGYTTTCTSTAQALSAPTGLKVVDLTCSSVTLSWEKVENATGYEVVRTLGSNTTYNTTETSITIDNLDGGKENSWKVRAIGDGINYNNSEYAVGENFTTLFSVKYYVDGVIWHGCANGCVANGGSFDICEETPTKANNTFIGWATSAGGEVAYQAGETINNIAANVTLHAVWEAVTYIVNWSVNGEDNIVPYTHGQALQLPEIDVTPCDGMEHVGWTDNMGYVHETDLLFTETTGMTVTGDQTYYAVFATPSGSSGDGDYVKVTEDANDLSGKYLIVYEEGNLAFNGGLTTLDAENNTIDVTIDGNTIKSTSTTDAAKFTITKNGDAYIITSASNYHIGQTSDANGLLSSTSTSYTNTITITDGNADIIGSGKAHLRYNSASNQNRFRYYKSTTYTSQQPIALYKKSGSSASYTDYTTGCHDVTITYYGFTGGYTTNCGGSELNVITQRVNSAHTIPNCTEITDPTTLGRTFLNLWKDQNGKEHKPGDSFIVTQDITLYAQWKLETTGDIELPADKEDLATTDIVVTGGKTLTIPEGETITINSLTLKGGLLGTNSESGYAMPSVVIPDNATLVRKNTTINLDLVVNNDSWYPFAVPFAIDDNSNIDYLDPVLKAASTYNTHFAIKTYDGANRAIVGTDQENNWDKVKQTAGLQPGKGYIISALTYPNKDTATIRIPMTVDNAWLANGEQESITVKEQTTTRNQVAVTAYTGKASDPNNGGHQRHAGWNFVANPYLSNFTGGTNPSNVEGSFINGEIIINNGEYDYGGDDVPYVTIPDYDFAHYDQVKLSDATLSPAYSFFVQVGKSGTMTFETAGRQQAPASIAARNAEERPVKMDVDITLSDNHSSDQTGIIISDRYNDTYEIGRDLEKLFGSAYNLSVYTLMADNTPLAFQALAIRSNMQVIPVGYRAPEQGEYTFRLNEATSSIDLLNEQYEQLVLVDYQTGELTNLLISDYTFYSERTQADNRFAIYAVPRQNAPTDLPNAIGQDKQAQKIIHNGHLYILRDGNVYNGNGQIVK